MVKTEEVVLFRRGQANTNKNQFGLLRSRDVHLTDTLTLHRSIYYYILHPTSTGHMGCENDKSSSNKYYFEPPDFQ